MKKFIGFVAATILTSTALLGATTATAQQAQQSAPPSGALEEVVVTARYREEKLQETPIAITAITAEDIQVRGFTTGYEIAYTVPNASFRQTQAAFGNTMSAFIRGIGQYDFLPEFEPGVGIYFDDVLHPFTMGSAIDLMDLERVEVLRGPQGTLFGRGAIGGAIRYVSKKPQGDDTGSIQVTYGDYDRIDVRGTYDFSLSENVFARVTGVSKEREGYQDVLDFACANPALAGSIPSAIPNRLKGCKVGTQGGEDVVGGRVSLRAVANEDLEFLFTGDYQNDTSEARADSLIALSPLTGFFGAWNQDYVVANYGVPFDERFLTNDPYTTYASYSDPRSGLTFKPQTALEQQGVSAKMEWNVGENVLVELIGSYREFESNFATDADGGPLNEQTVDQHSDVESTTAELRFSGRLADSIDWTVGGFYYDGEFATAQTVSLPPITYGILAIVVGLPPDVAGGAIETTNRFLVNALNITKSENTSAFAHFVWDVTDRLALTVGGRYSTDKKDEDFDNSIVQAQLATDESRTDWKAGIDFKFTDTVLAYGSAATGYRPQAFNPRPFQYTQFVQVDGEEATSYELGIKGDFFDRRLRLNLAGFYIDYNQRILPVGGVECIVNPNPPPTYLPPADPNNPGAIDSLGNACDVTTSLTRYENFPGEVTGAEVEMTFRPVEALTISAIYGYTGWKSDDIDNPTEAFGPAAAPVINDLPIYVPEQNWNVAMSYAFGTGGGSTVTPRVDVYGQTEICSSTISRLACADGYELVNARVDWASPDQAWQIALGLNNATDEEYLLNIFDLSPFGQPTTEGQPGRPQEWYVQFTRNFK
ncbi:MAG TPA: TonB-dependent receptor [Steroidobacteraceae bacterium]|nr:TonB-dependent receptor [Steroidobacteraceae bacterium]